MAGRLQDGSDSVDLELPRSRLLRDDGRGLLPAERWAVRPRFGHGVIRVSSGKQARRRCPCSSDRPSVIARAVEALMVERGDIGESYEERRPG